MRALLLRDVGAVETVDVPDPEPADGEVVVEVAAAGVCGSDVHTARDGGMLRTLPLVMGHELVGTVQGRRVAVNPFISCGACDLCGRGHDQLCRHRRIIGIQRAGGFAERVCVPADRLVELPDSVSVETGALVEPLAVALHAVELGALTENTRLAILGAGTIGLLAARLCVGRVADLVIVDRNAARREQAGRLVPAEFVAGLEGEFDVTIDAVGTMATHAASVEHLRPEGTSVWVGNEGTEPSFDAQELVRTGRRVLGSAAYTSDEFRQAARLVDDTLLDWTSVRHLSEGPAVFDTLMSATAGNGPVKFLLRP